MSIFGRNIEGGLSLFGNGNSIRDSRDAAGHILANGGSVALPGGPHSFNREQAHE